MDIPIRELRVLLSPLSVDNLVLLDVHSNNETTYDGDRIHDGEKFPHADTGITLNI